MFNPCPKPGKRKKRKRPGEDKEYKAWILTQPCCNPNCPGNCGEVTGAHQRILGNGGTSLTPPDRDMLPLGKFCHDKEHKGSITFWGHETKADTKEFVQNLCDEHYGRFNRTKAR